MVLVEGSDFLRVFLQLAHGRVDLCLEIGLRNPVQRGHRFQRKADSNPVIADSR